MLRRVQVLGLQGGSATSVRQLQVAVGRVGVQGGFEPDWDQRHVIRGLRARVTWYRWWSWW